MKSIEILLSELNRLDIKLWIENGRLRFNAPAGAMSESLRDEIKACKSDLVRLLENTTDDHAAKITPDPEHRFDPFPLTRIQQAYWIGRSDNTFELGGVSAHVYAEIEGLGLDVAGLQVAWNHMIARHDMLRAVVDPDGYQRVLESVPIYTIKTHDQISATGSQTEAHFDHIRKQLSHKVAAAETWPLFDIEATVLADDRVCLHLSFDGLIFDATSILLLAQECWTMYQKPDAFLKPINLTFRDYVLAENQAKDGENYRRARAYWWARMDEIPAAPDLPLIIDPASLTLPEFIRRQHKIDAPLWRKLKEKAQAAGLTPSALLLTAFSDVLALWSRSPHFTVNLSMFNRLPIHDQVNDIVGDFTTLNLLEVDTASAPQLLDRARKLQERLWQDMDHADVSGVEVLSELSRRRGWIGKAAMPVVFTSALALDAVNETDSDINPFGDLVWGITQTPQVSLDVLVVEHKGHLVFAWDTVDALFPQGVTEAMFETYCTYLTDMATQGHDLSAIERPRWKRAQTFEQSAPISEGLLHQPVFDMAATNPAAPAVITSQLTVNYGDLCGLAARIAQDLQGNGLQPGELVAVSMEKGWEQVVAVLAVLAAGGVFVPIDPSWPETRRAGVLTRIEARFALIQARQAQDFSLPNGVQPVIVDAAQLGMQADPPEPTRHPDDLAYIIFTSGSTGTPKGVMISHRGALNTCEDVNRRWDVGSKDRTLALSALSFDLAIYDVFGLLAAGGAIVMPDPGSEKDPGHWLKMASEHGVTLWNSVPQLLKMFVEYTHGTPDHPPLSVRLALLSGDWIPVSLPDQARAAFDGLTVISLGGATEGSIWSIFYPIGTVDPAWTSIPYGRALNNQSMHVLNRDLNVCPPWVTGDIYIGGTGVAKGYWKDQERTNASFITGGSEDEDLYRTGDLGRLLPDGNIEFMGREDQQVKIGGFRIELGDIEATLNSHPGVQEAIVNPVGDNREHRQLAAYVVRGQQIPPQQGAAQADRHDAGEVNLQTPEGQRNFKLARPGIRKPATEDTVVPLPNPELTDSRVADFMRRQSFREFVQDPLSLDSFGRFLDCLAALRLETTPFPKYLYASAGNLYPVQTYLHIKEGRIDGLDGGLYYHDPEAHTLVRMRELTEIPESIHGQFNRAFFGTTAFSIFLVGKLDAIAPLYADHARDFCLLEAGYMSQLMMERAPENAIGLCPIGFVQFDEIHQQLGLGADHILVHSLVGGLIAPKQLQHWGMTPVSVVSRPTAEELKLHMAQKIPDYMVPATFIFLEKLPLSANGKVDRTALPAPTVAINIRPVSPSHKTPSDHTEGPSLSETIVADCVATVLKVDNVDPNYNFFDLGADSIQIIQIRNELQKRLDQPFDVLDFFRYPTAALFSKELLLSHKLLHTPKKEKYPVDGQQILKRRAEYIRRQKEKRARP